MDRDKYLGVMLGLAIGDALGAPVEFKDRGQIVTASNPDGVTTLLPWGGHPAGSYTDDTQMSIATAQGTLAAHQAGAFASSDEAAPYVWEAYQAWLVTQQDPAQRRAPGNTCLSALGGGVMGTPEGEPLNDSKGCGTIMRVAPCALLYPDSPFDWAMVCGAMTHSHPTGYLAGAAFAEILRRVLNGEGLAEAISATTMKLIDYLPDSTEVWKVLQLVLDQHEDDQPLIERIEAIGEGWVAEETLGIAMQCGLEYTDSFADAVLAAVNITGDSDSTGSVTGALMGAMLGAEVIPAEWVQQVENADLLAQLANDLYDAQQAR